MGNCYKNSLKHVELIQSFPEASGVHTKFPVAGRSQKRFPKIVKFKNIPKAFKTDKKKDEACKIRDKFS